MSIKKTFLVWTALLCATVAGAANLVILHTNDTHSLIYPDEQGRGGVLQRKAVIDSIRNAEKNVILVDAGDVVQGTLFFKFFKGEVEYPLMDMMGYDIRILGNHEFDNGIYDLAKYYKKSKATSLSANYDFSGTPLEGIFEPYTIRNIGGKKIGFFGINIDPKSLITEENYHGIIWHDVIKIANETAAFLKKDKKCDLVVAVTHIGYIKQNEKTTDVELAQASKDIDIIIGGHSHTLIDPDNSAKYPHLIKNSEGKNVLVTQTGKSGRYLGYIKINLDNLSATADGNDFTYRLIPITDRFSSEKLDKKIEKFLNPYRAKVDSVNNIRVGKCITKMKGSSTGAFANWTADFGFYYGGQIVDSLRNTGRTIPPIDFAMMNIGGIRRDFNEGYITQGDVLSAFPFSNKIVLVKIKGSDLFEALSVAASKGGEAVSDEIRVTLNPDNSIHSVIINGNKLEPNRNYLFATIDYLAWGNDDLDALARGEIIWSDKEEMSVRILQYINHLTSLGMPITAPDNNRFLPAISL